MVIGESRRRVVATRAPSATDTSLGFSGRYPFSVSLENQTLCLPSAQSAVITVCDGTAQLCSETLPPGSSVWVPNTSDVEITGSGRIGGVLLGPNLESSWAHIKQPELTWYEKYHAHLAPVNFEIGGEDRILPWSAYHVEEPWVSPFEVHVHHKVRNIVFVIAQPGQRAGYLVAEHQDHVCSWEMESGDIVVVEPGIPHTLICAPNADALRILVFNDGISEYERPDSSDFHRCYDCELESTDRRERLMIGSMLFHVGVDAHSDVAN